MKAIEFKSKIVDNKILIPLKIQYELNLNQNKPIRFIVFTDDSETYDNILFQSAAAEGFFKGYSDSDSVYDKYPG